MADELEKLLQWSGWAAAFVLIGGLVAAWLQRRTAKEQTMIQARLATISAAKVEIEERTAEMASSELANRTYQGIITVLTSRVDTLENRVVALETREQDCLKRLAQVEEERRRDQAEFWRRGTPHDG